MSKITLSRCVAVLVTVLGSLLVLPSPASATPFVGTSPSGLLDLTRSTNPMIQIPLTGPSSFGCPSSTVDVDVANTAGPTSAVDITGLYSQAPFSTLGGGTWVSVITRLSSTPGTSGSINPITGIGLALRLQVFYVASGTLCTPANRACSFDVFLTVSGQHSAFPTTSSNTTFTLNGGPATIFQSSFSCRPPFNSYSTGSGQIVLMGFHLV